MFAMSVLFLQRRKTVLYHHNNLDRDHINPLLLLGSDDHHLSGHSLHRQEEEKLESVSLYFYIFNCKHEYLHRINNAPEDADDKMSIQPTGQMSEQNLDNVELRGSQDVERDGKFLNYWMTLTKTLTLTSHTVTSTIASLSCTPPGFPYGACAANGVGK